MRMTQAILSNEHELDILFHALSNQTRRSLLAQLRMGPRIVTELASSYKMSLNAISKHLLVLEKAGLIDRKVEGRIHICRLQAEPMMSADKWLQNYEEFWSNNLDSFVDYIEREHIQDVDNKDEQ